MTYVGPLGMNFPETLQYVDAQIKQQRVIDAVLRAERIKAEAALAPLAPIIRRFADSQHPRGMAHLCKLCHGEMLLDLRGYFCPWCLG